MVQTQNQQMSNEQLIQQMQQQYDQLFGQAQKYAGRPDRPEWESLIDPNTGLLQSQLMLDNQYNQDALNQLRQEGLRGPGEASAWRGLMDQRLTQQAGQASAGAQAATQNAMSGLAMRGGLRAGTAERLAARGADQAVEAQQRIFGQGLNLDIQDEQQRLASLGALNQAELQAGQFGQGVQQFNIQQALNENLQKRAEQINAYNEQMRAWASERTAQATPSGGGGGKK